MSEILTLQGHWGFVWASYGAATLLFALDMAMTFAHRAGVQRRLRRQFARPSGEQA